MATCFLKLFILNKSIINKSLSITLIKITFFLLFFCLFTHGQAENTLTISSGPVESNYNLAAGTLCNLLNNSKLNIPCFTLPSKGLKHNLSRLLANKAKFAIVPADFYYYIKDGYPHLKPLTGLYTETLFITVQKDSPIQTLEDLKDHTINLGPENSSIWQISRRLLQTAHINLTDLSAVTLLNPTSQTARDALCKGETEVLFLMDSTPSTYLHELISSCPIRILSLPKQQVDKVTQDYPYFNPSMIPKGNYYNLPEIHSVGIDTLLLANKNILTHKQAYHIVELFFDRLNTIKKQTDIFQQTHPGVLTSATRFSHFHVGAVAYFKTIGLL